jgi:hypothetical protein
LRLNQDARVFNVGIREVRTVRYRRASSRKAAKKHEANEAAHS